MTNTARHGIGAVIGVIVTPIAWLLLTYGGGTLWRTVAQYVMRVSLTGTILPMLALLAAAALLGLLASTFVSPVAAVIAGAVNLVAGLAYPLMVRTMFDVTAWLPSRFQMDASNAGLNGTYLVIGVVLLVTAVPPRRWKAAAGIARPVPPPGYASQPPPAPPNP